MVLVAEHRDGHIDRSGRLGIVAFLHLGLGVFDPPARIAILLPALGRRPVRRDPPFLDRGLLHLGVALFRRVYDSPVVTLTALARYSRSLHVDRSARTAPTWPCPLHSPPQTHRHMHT